VSRRWPLSRPSPELAATLREATRIDALATALGPGADAATVRRELDQRPVAQGRARRTGAARARRIERPYGPVWAFRRAPFFATRPVPFLGIPLDGGAVVVFDPGPRPDLAAPAARYALDRLAGARGWELPADLGRADAAVALLDVALADPDRFLPADRPVVGDVRVTYAGRWAGGTDDDELVVGLEPLVLTVNSRRYGPIGGASA
jgi:hypothetical protein